METKKHSSSLPAGTRQRRTKTTRRSRWLGLLVTFVLLFGFGQTAKAWSNSDFTIVTYADKVTSASPAFAFHLNMGEADGAWSFWGDYYHYIMPHMYINDQELPYLPDSNPNLNRGLDYYWKAAANNVAKWPANASNETGRISLVRIWWDPASYIRASYSIVPKYIFIDQPLQFKIIGNWHKNGVDATNQTVYTLNVDISKIKAPIWGTISRSQGKISYSGSLTNADITNYDWSLTLFTSKPGATAYVAPTSSNCLDGTKSAESGAQSINATFNNATNYYQGYTLYPRMSGVRKASGYYYYYDDYGNMPAESNTLIKDYDPIKVPGYPRAANVSVEGKKWTKTVNLSWSSEIYDSNNCNTDGKWYIYRKNLIDNSVELVGSEIGYNTRTFTDNSETLEYEKPYTYYVCFVPNGWTVNSWTDVAGLWASKDLTLEREYYITTTATGNEASITVKANYGKVPSNIFNSLKYSLYRQRNDGNWEELTTNGTLDTDTTTTYTDNGVNAGCNSYRYRFSLRLMEKTFTGESEYAKVGLQIGVNSIDASKGRFVDRVKLRWDVTKMASDKMKYIIARKEIGSESTDYQTIYSMESDAATLYYEDETAVPGIYYNYRVTSYMPCDGTEGDQTATYTLANSMSDDGFRVNTGVITGRVTYGTGTAVEGVKVSVLKATDDDAKSQFYAVAPNGGTLQVKMTAEDADKIYRGEGKSFTLQGWVKTDAVTKGNATILDISGSAHLGAIANGTNFGLQLLTGNGSYSNLDFTLQPSKYYHFTYVRDGATGMGTVYFIDPMTGEVLSQSLSTPVISETSTNNLMMSIATNMACVDDVRLWSKALTQDEILGNYDHPLIGTEKGLVCYLPLDEGIQGLGKAYDISKTDGVPNGHHGTFSNNNMMFTTEVPDKSWFSLFCRTDADGNYTLRGIPFSGDGTNYNVVPSLGIHEFSPQKQSRYLSGNSLSFSGVDFQDVSSFPVSGHVYFENTNVPVEGAFLYVDGNVSTKNNMPVQTDADGYYEISVPIGDHYISVKKNQHTFVKDGRYPEDFGGGNLHTFDRTVYNLDFYDNTMVTIAGRVTGGQIEYDKPLGFGESENNIGQVKLKLTLNDASSGYFLNYAYNTEGTTSVGDFNENRLDLEAATPAVNSEAWRGYGSQVEAQAFYILTDKKTGEFAVKVPPLLYKISAADIVNNNDNITLLSSLPQLDASDPDSLKFKCDTLKVGEEVKGLFHYTASWKSDYHSTPHFDVVQEGMPAGIFGNDSISFYDEYTGKELTLPCISEGQYQFNNSPVFEQGRPYTFDITAYELYTNYDPTDEEQSRLFTVPLSGSTVTVSNALSEEQSVYTASAENGSQAGSLVELTTNEFALDSLGHAVYQWWAGYPDITAPYNHRGVNFNYTIGSRYYDWREEPLAGIILGNLPTGANFVTAGPDEVKLVLRDPPGSNSSASWEKGSSKSVSYEGSYTAVSENSIYLKHKLGFDVNLTTGAVTPVTATLQTNHVEVEDDAETGVEIIGEIGADHSWNEVITTTQSISTSDDPEWVGADADLFFGCGTNLIFSKDRELKVAHLGNGYGLTVDDGMSMGQQYKTTFLYTQRYIKEMLIPNLKSMRNNLLKTVSRDTYPTQDALLANYPKKAKEYQYVTYLSPDDENFGTSNSDRDVWGDQATPDRYMEKGPSYNIIPPTTPSSTVDSVLWYNQQIALWEQTLANNEKAKVKAKEGNSSHDKTNLSISAGGSYTNTWSREESEVSNFISDITVRAHLNLVSGTMVNKTGFCLIKELREGAHTTNNAGTGKDSTLVISYTLAEEGNDAISVDVYNTKEDLAYGEGMAVYDATPMFITRAGQTSCPYEGATVTEYYKPGTELNKATMQIEKPDILIDRTKHSRAVNIPNGRAAQYKVVLTNTSEIGLDGDFRLSVDPKTNKNGAAITMDGINLLGDGGQIVNIAYGDSVVKYIQLTQTDQSVLEYDSIAIHIGSQCDGSVDEVAYISAQFVPSSSNVRLRIPQTTVNTTSELPELNMIVDDYDVNYRGFRGLRMQFRYAGDAEWTSFRQYYVGSNTMGNGAEELPAGGFTYPLDMTSYSDGNYQFRIESVAEYDNEEVTCYSDIIDVIKDTSKPQRIGNTSPSDGILNYGDEISVTFNEDIRNGALQQQGNFTITGTLNGAQVNHSVALQLTGSEAAASTEANINLSEKSFSMETWINATSEGTFFSQGKGSNKFTLGINSSNKLVANIGGTEYVSSGTMPMNKWSYLMVSYDYADGNSKLTARVNYDSYSTSLFAAQPVADHAGIGPVSLGGGMTGAVHEMSLWNTAHTQTEAELYMNVTKKPTEPGLIGYWKLDEGNGIIATDAARSRNMVLGTSNWYVNSVNYAATLDGTKALKMPIGTCNAGKDEDYAVELWFKGGSDNQDAGLLTASDCKVRLGFTDGLLTLTADDTDYTVSQSDYLDDAWHHVALNVLRNGYATVYVDGTAQKQLSSSKVPALQGYAIFLGADSLNAYNVDKVGRFFKGSIDEVRLWNATLSAAALNAYRMKRLKGDEAGLGAYYPFELKMLESGQVETIISLKDQTGNGNIMRLEAEDGTISDIPNSQFSTQAPGLKELMTETNLAFTFVANERKIVITPAHEASEMEGCTLNFTVKNVVDLNGNYSNPIRWSVYVRQNQLRWADDADIAVEQQGGESTTFEATISNESGENENWSLTGLPTWLTASVTSGTLKALSTKTITFTVAPSTPIGKYEETIYLVGNKEIYEPLTVNLKVKGEEPDWAVNTGGYQFTMSIVGQLQFQNLISDDEDDIVAAFNEAGDCVGLARPQYESAFGTYFTMMTIYGNEDGNEPLVFKAFDASTGKVYPVVETADEVYFAKDARLGKLASAFIWNVTDKIEQVIDLKEGWNWMSLYVTPDDMSPSVVLADASDILTIINGPTSTAEYDPSIGWSGTLTAMNNASMYKLNATTDGTATIVGSPANIAGTQITVKSGLTWIGYPPSFTLSPADAFAGLDPGEDDMVKNQSGFAVYSEANAKWIGTLKVMEPGKGYIYSSEAAASKTFTYPSVAPAGGAAKVMAYAEPYDYHFSPVAPETYPGNMAVIGQVVENGLPVEGIEVAAFVDDECRATIVSDADGYLFLLVPGDGKVRMMTLRAYILGDETALDLPLTYQADKKLGTLGSPVLIDITDLTTGIGRLREDAADGEYYDLSGRKLGTRPYQPGVYIRNGEKVVIKRK